MQGRLRWRIARSDILTAMTNLFNLLHVGLGPLGKLIVADAHARRVGHVHAAVEIDPRVVGKRLDEVVPGSGFDTRVVASLDEVSDWDRFDCAIVSTSSDLARCADTFRTILKRGVSIVSTCEELLYPWLRHSPLAEELDTLARETGTRLVGTGVNPGFMMDALPVAATAVCRHVRRVHVWRIQDATTRRVPFQKKIGAGLDDAAFNARIKDGSLRHVGLGESLHFISRYLHLDVSRWEETIEPVRAERDLSCELGPIRKGVASGVRQVARGWNARDSEPVVRLEFQAAIGQQNPPAHDRVRIEAEPVIDLTITGGVHGDVATTAITLNAVRPLLSAPPGLHTMATMPMTYAAAGFRPR